jgi:glyoxylate/hydroxypyruvate reductase
MTLLVICQNKEPQPWVDALMKIDSRLDIRIWPDEGEPNDITFALVWQHPHGVLQRYPNLKTVSSMGAGVDHILQDPQLPSGLKLVRIIDPGLVDDMFDYLSMAVASYRHHQHRYFNYQASGRWSPDAPLKKSALTIGVMGLGQLGEVVASRFAAQNFKVVGWSTSEKNIPQVTAFVGESQQKEFFNRTNILINLLPLTDATRSILNAVNLSQLKKPAYLINVGRGQHLVEDDLRHLLESEKLSGACLDVFSEEPLSVDHWFWRHPQIKVTPHVSSLTQPDRVAPQIVQNYQQTFLGLPLLNQVDLNRGY